MEEFYRWTERSYDAVQAAGVDWRAVVHVLRDARPRIRGHVGSVLRIAAPSQHGRWIVVSLIEEDDDQYEVVAARLLNDDETEAARKMIGGQQP